MLLTCLLQEQELRLQKEQLTVEKEQALASLKEKLIQVHIQYVHVIDYMYLCICSMMCLMLRNT